MGSFVKDAAGKYLVLFNGTNIPCTFGNDTVCPASAVCMKDLSWSAISEQCVCEFWFAKTGDDCNSIISDGIIMAVLGSLIAFVASCSFLTAFVNLIRVSRVSSRDRSTVLLVLVLLAATSEIMIAAYWLLRLNTNSSIFIGGSTKKTSTYRVYGTISLPLNFLLTSLALLHVSLTWMSLFVSIAGARTRDATSKAALRRRAVIHHRLLFGYYGIFFIAFVYSTVVDQLTVVVIVSVVAILFIIISYAYGAFKVHRLLQIVDKKKKARPQVRTATRSDGAHSIEQESLTPTPLNRRDSSGIPGTENSQTTLTSATGSLPSTDRQFAIKSLRSIRATAIIISMLATVGLSLCLSFVLKGGELNGNNPEKATSSILMYAFVLVASSCTFIVGVYGMLLVNTAIWGQNGAIRLGDANDRMVGKRKHKNGGDGSRMVTGNTAAAADQTTMPTSGPMLVTFADDSEPKN